MCANEGHKSDLRIPRNATHGIWTLPDNKTANQLQLVHFIQPVPIWPRGLIPDALKVSKYLEALEKDIQVQTEK